MDDCSRNWETWEITTRHAQFLYAKGKVKEVQKFRNIWVISKRATKPQDGRTKEARANNTESAEEYRK